MTDRLALLQAGRLSQTCPACGMAEAAGYFCSKCGQRTGSDDWAAQEAASRSGHASARSRAQRGSDKPLGPESGSLA